MNPQDVARKVARDRTLAELGVKVAADVPTDDKRDERDRVREAAAAAARSRMARARALRKVGALETSPDSTNIEVVEQRLRRRDRELRDRRDQS